MTYKEVLKLVKRAGEPDYGYGSYIANGRMRMRPFNKSIQQPGTYGNPYKDSYGYALDQRSKMTRPSDFIVGSHSLPDSFYATNITQGLLADRRMDVALSNAKKLVPGNLQMKSWAYLRFKLGGERNAKAWQKNKTLAPETTHLQWTKDPNYQKLQPLQQTQFRRVFNSMAYRQPQQTAAIS